MSRVQAISYPTLSKASRLRHNTNGTREIMVAAPHQKSNDTINALNDLAWPQAGVQADCVLLGRGFDGRAS